MAKPVEDVVGKTERILLRIARNAPVPERAILVRVAAGLSELGDRLFDSPYTVELNNSLGEAFDKMEAEMHDALLEYIRLLGEQGLPTGEDDDLPTIPPHEDWVG